VRTAKVERSTRGVEKGLLSPPLVVEVGDEDKGREGVIESEEENTALPLGDVVPPSGAIHAGLPSRREREACVALGRRPLARRGESKARITLGQWA
jgi:hypothetical protein